MTNRFFSPDQQFVDATGLPYAGGKLYFYLTNSDTPEDTYSDYELTVANANPVVLDERGNAGSIFLQNVAYKVRLFDVDDNEIWTEDPVWSSDYSTYAALKPYNGNPNGLVSGHAATVGTLPGTDQIWDYVNNILYVCTTSGSAATTVWTAVNQTTTATFVPTPTGYLTPTSGVPVIPTDVSAATALYYTPYTGTTVPIYSGSAFTSQTFAELTLTLVSAHAANTIYDVFVFNNSGVLTLVTGPAWSTSTAGSGARGTGAGTTQLQSFSGIWVNAVQITGRNGSTTYTVSANLATYLGSILIDGSAGQVTFNRTFGQNRRWAAWNAYNRVPIALMMGDATSSWGYGTATFRQSNGSANNTCFVLCGLAEEILDIDFTQYISASTASNSVAGGTIGIGINSTTVASGVQAQAGLISVASATGLGAGASVTARYEQPPALGLTSVNSLEKGGGGNQSFSGASTSMLLTVQYRG